MLHKLPPEILDMVAQSLTSKQDLKSLALVSRAVHRGVQRTLWSSLDLWPIEEDELWHFNWKPVFHENLPAFIYPTELNFRSTISSPQGERCPHWRDQESPPNNRLHANSRFGCLALMAESVVRISPPRRLRKFTWGLGTCIPGKILGRRGILARTQPQLSSLDLTTVGDCLIRDEIDLSPFRRLKEFRWRGPRADDLDAIADVLQTNCEHLTSLELDFVDWDRLRDQMGYEPEIDAIEGVVVDRFFHTKILSIGPQTILEKPIFPALVSLSLSSVPLLGRTARALDFTALKSLTIRKCPQWDRFLAEIPKLGVPLRLKSLEVHQQYEPQTPRGTVMTPEHEILIRFITSFTGLEELFLSLIGPIDSMALWNKVVKRHGTTLKRFVHHLCAPEDNGPTPASNNNVGTPAITVIPYIYDIPDFDLAPKLRELSEKNPLSNIYQPESIGLSCIPEVLGPMFSSFVRTHTSNSSLKLIHVRQSRPMDSDIDRTSARDLAANPTILLPTSYNGSFQTGARHPVSVHESIYGASSIFPDIGAQGTNKDQGQKYEDGELEVDWANEAERIVELTGNGSPLLHHPDNGNSSANSSRHPSPSRNSSAFSPSYHEALIWPDQPQPGLRQSLVRFANWAFGPKGISSLEVIACGDFAYGRWNRGRELGNVFLVRNRNKDNREYQNLNFLVFWPGRENGPGSQSMQRQKAGYYLTGIPKVDQIIETNRRFLEASPMEPLVDDDLPWPGRYRDMS